MAVLLIPLCLLSLVAVGFLQMVMEELALGVAMAVLWGVPTAGLVLALLLVLLGGEWDLE